MDKRRCRGCGNREGDSVGKYKVTFSTTDGYTRHKCNGCRRHKVPNNYPRWYSKVEPINKVSKHYPTVAERVKEYFDG